MADSIASKLASAARGAYDLVTAGMTDKSCPHCNGTGLIQAIAEEKTLVKAKKDLPDSIKQDQLNSALKNPDMHKAMQDELDLAASKKKN